MKFYKNFIKKMSIRRFIDESEPKVSYMTNVVPIPVENRFILTGSMSKRIRARGYTFGFGPFSDVVFYRTYSREVNGKKETFPDVVVRNIEGILSILKNHFINNGLYWNDLDWIEYGIEMGHMMMDLKFLPPGRGLYICGTEHSYQRGGCAFNNCGFVSTIDGILHSSTQMMDLLMCGCGIGFDTEFKDSSKIFLPGCIDCRLSKNKAVNKEKTCGCNILEYVIHDSREGWVKSLFLLLRSYLIKSDIIHFDYSDIRGKGAPIKGFGGTSSGYEPLKQLHDSIRHFMECFEESKTNSFNAAINLCQREGELEWAIHIINSLKEKYDKLNMQIVMLECSEDIIPDRLQQIKILYEERLKVTKTYGTSRLVVDINNAIGRCVVAGNVRRSSEIALGNARDNEFLNLKNYDLNPERTPIGWMSNNTIVMKRQEDFLVIPSITERIKVNGEPGIMNLINVQEFGRIGKKHPIGREKEHDAATGLNPCAEISLESGELCNLCEVFISKCKTYEEMEKAVKFATFYTTTVSLLQTHWSNTNSIIARNRRIGISLSGIADYYDNVGPTELIRVLKTLYGVVRSENSRIASLAGIPASIRVTTVKPSGTISLLAGCSAGCHWPEFETYIRRIRIATNSDIVPILKEANIPWEYDSYSGNGTTIFEFPINQGKTRCAQDVSIWEQAMLQVSLQREWSDNSVSITLKLNPEKENNILENVVAQIMPSIKSVSIIPHTDSGVYKQAPYEKISIEEFEIRSSTIKEINWNSFLEKIDMPRGCDGDRCTI